MPGSIHGAQSTAQRAQWTFNADSPEFFKEAGEAPDLRFLEFVSTSQWRTVKSNYGKTVVVGRLPSEYMLFEVVRQQVELADGNIFFDVEQEDNPSVPHDPLIPNDDEGEEGMHGLRFLHPNTNFDVKFPPDVFETLLNLAIYLDNAENEHFFSFFLEDAKWRSRAYSLMAHQLKDYIPKEAIILGHVAAAVLGKQPYESAVELGFEGLRTCIDERRTPKSFKEFIALSAMTLAVYYGKSYANHWLASRPKEQPNSRAILERGILIVEKEGATDYSLEGADIRCIFNELCRFLRGYVDYVMCSSMKVSPTDPQQNPDGGRDRLVWIVMFSSGAVRDVVLEKVSEIASDGGACAQKVTAAVYGVATVASVGNMAYKGYKSYKTYMCKKARASQEHGERAPKGPPASAEEGNWGTKGANGIERLRKYFFASCVEESEKSSCAAKEEEGFAFQEEANETYADGQAHFNCEGKEKNQMNMNDVKTKANAARQKGAGCTASFHINAVIDGESTCAEAAKNTATDTAKDLAIGCGKQTVKKVAVKHACKLMGKAVSPLADVGFSVYSEFSHTGTINNKTAARALLTLMMVASGGSLALPIVAGIVLDRVCGDDGEDSEETGGLSDVENENTPRL